MKSEEYKYLVDMKLHKGLCLETAKKEISKLSNSQNLFKNLTRELRKKDKIIKNKDNEIEKLKNKIKRQKDKAIKENLKIISNIKPTEHELNIHELKRILRTMRLKNIPLTRKEIEKESGLNGKTEEGLRFLIKENLIKCDNQRYEIC